MEFNEEAVVGLAITLLPSCLASGRSVEQAIKYSFILAEAFAKEVEKRASGEGETPVIT